MKKLLKIVIPVVVIAIVGYLWLASTDTFTSGGVTEGHIAVSFMFDPGNTVELEYPYNNQKSVFAITKSISEEKSWPFIFEDYGEMGILITQIRYKINGDNNKYWQYEVKGETPMVGVTEYFLEAGDKLEWKFKESEL